MADAHNPYAPPTAPLQEPVGVPDSLRRFIPSGRRVAAGRGAAWLRDAWRLFWEEPGRWLLTLLCIVALNIIVSLIPFGNLLNSLLWPFVCAGLVTAANRQQNTGTFELDSLFAGSRKAAPLLVVAATGLLTVVAVFASFAIVLGGDLAYQILVNPRTPALQPHAASFLLTALVAFALVLPITAAIYLAPPLIMLHDISPGAAMKMSLIVSIRNILPGIVFGLCVMAFMIVSILPLGLGLLVSIPVLLITNYTVYRDLFLDTQPTEQTAT